MKKLEWVSVSSFWLSVVCYLGARVILWLPALSFVLAIIGLIVFDKEKHKQRWYAIAGLILSVISFVLGLNDNFGG